MRGRASGVKSAHSVEQQAAADKSTTSDKCTRATAGGVGKAPVANPTAIFSDTASGVSMPLSSDKAVVAPESRVSRRTAAAGGFRASTVDRGNQSAVSRPRSPWRYSTSLKPVRSSDAVEVGRGERAGGGATASTERQQRRPRASSTSRVRRTKSAQSAPSANPPMPPSILKPPTQQLLAALHVETPAVERPEPKSPDPTAPVHATTEQTPKDKPAPASGVIARAWRKVAHRVGGPGVNGGRLQPVLVALLVIALAVVGGCVYAYLVSETTSF